MPDAPTGVNLSGGLLSLRYRSTTPLEKAIITLKPMGGRPAGERLIPTEIFTRFAATGQRREIQIPLPATPGLSGIKELVITFGPEIEREADRPHDHAPRRLADLSGRRLRH